MMLGCEFQGRMTKPRTGVTIAEVFRRRAKNCSNVKMQDMDHSESFVQVFVVLGIVSSHDFVSLILTILYQRRPTCPDQKIPQGRFEMLIVTSTMNLFVRPQNCLGTNEVLSREVWTLDHCSPPQHLIHSFISICAPEVVSSQSVARLWLEINSEGCSWGGAVDNSMIKQ